MPKGKKKKHKMKGRKKEREMLQNGVQEVHAYDVCMETNMQLQGEQVHLPSRLCHL